jgi:hypothetical protein
MLQKVTPATALSQSARSRGRRRAGPKLGCSWLPDPGPSIECRNRGRPAACGRLHSCIVRSEPVRGPASRDRAGPPACRSRSWVSRAAWGPAWHADARSRAASTSCADSCWRCELGLEIRNFGPESRGFRLEFSVLGKDVRILRTQCGYLGQQGLELRKGDIRLRHAPICARKPPSVERSVPGGVNGYSNSCAGQRISAP